MDRDEKFEKKAANITAKQFEFCVNELIKAKEEMSAKAVLSKNPEKIETALALLLDGNKALISALDVAYKKLHEAGMSIN